MLGPPSLPLGCGAAAAGHADDLPEWLVRENGDPMAFGVNIPLVDRDEINGATDVVPGAHVSYGIFFVIAVLAAKPFFRCLGIETLRRHA
eukprot:SAG31_NODE_184_length_20985_cov_28.867567_21_plen_90_part_00